MSENVKSPFLTIFEKDGKHWVDTGHADVGPFDTRTQAKEHIWQILDSRKNHDTETTDSKSKLQTYIDELNEDYFVDHFNANAPETLFSLEQRTHHHQFAETNAIYPEDGVVECVCSCGVKVYYIEDEEETNV